MSEDMELKIIETIWNEILKLDQVRLARVMTYLESRIESHMVEINIKNSRK